MRRIPSLDGLRGIAILFVLIGHSVHGLTAAGLPGASLIYALQISPAGVAVFFVLSGFLITTLLVQEKDKNGSVSLRNFYLRRLFRIVPAYYVYLVAIVVCGAIGLIEVPHHGILSAFSFTWNYSPHAQGWWFEHSWTLSMEEQFYILWPTIVALTSRRRMLAIAATFIAISPILRVMTYFLFPSSFRGVIASMLHTRSDALMFGAIVALLWDDARFQAWMDRCFALQLHVLAMIVAPCNEYLIWRLRGSYSLPVGMSVESACIAMLLVWSVRRPYTIFGAFLNWKPLMYVGTISYSLYLWQQPFLRPIQPGWTSRWPLSILLAGIMAVTSFKLVERPFLRLRELIARRAVTPATIGGTPETAARLSAEASPAKIA